jgi:hypothetical protein
MEFDSNIRVRGTIGLQITVNILGHVDIRRDPECHATTSGLAPSRSIWLECVVREFRKSLIAPIGRVRVSAKAVC